MFDNTEFMMRLKNIESLISEQYLLKKEMLTLSEASIYLDMSSSHLYKLTSGRQVPHYCPNGKKLYFKRSELDQWLQRNRTVTQEGLETEAAKYAFNNKLI